MLVAYSFFKGIKAEICTSKKTKTASKAAFGSDQNLDDGQCSFNRDLWILVQSALEKALMHSFYDTGHIEMKKEAIYQFFFPPPETMFKKKDRDKRRDNLGFMIAAQTDVFCLFKLEERAREKDGVG